MILFPPCKINFGLHILGKRPDGYHDLDTLMYQIPLNDIVELIPSETFSFTSSGLEIPGNIHTNLCIKAYKLMSNKYQIPAIQIHLHKIIPMGGGLGGGSANAAYTLLGINQLFELNLSIEKLQVIAAELGSDCPLFIEKNPQIAHGRGEILSPFPLELNGYYLKLVNLGIHVSTKEAFSNVEFSKQAETIKSLVSQPIDCWKKNLRNDFETSVFKFHPSLKLLKEKLYLEGAVYAAMSGSGSTMFGLYKSEPILSFNDTIFEKIIHL